jgi:hypothetical protein
LIIHEVFGVVYSPVKAFKEIVKNPTIKGPLLILVLVLFSMTFEQYVYASKGLRQIGTPDNDDWTEFISNQHNWTSNGNLLLDGTDYKRGNEVGNHSITSFVPNGTSIWMRITDIGTFNCSGKRGYTELFFWIKWVHENGTFPSFNATLRLFSESESSYYELDLTNIISNSSNEWSNATANNTTLKIGPGNQEWNPINSPNWESVTGLEFRLAWPTSANLTMKIDYLHFLKYASLLETGAFSSGSMIYVLMYGVMNFCINWFLWGGVLLLVVKAFGEKVGPWKRFFIIIGHVFSISVIDWLALAALLLTLSPFYSVPLWVSQLSFYIFLVIEIWTAVLCSIPIRLLCGITWRRATTIALIAFSFRFVLRFLLGL